MNSIELGDQAFGLSSPTEISSIWMIRMNKWIDLPYLNSIKLGDWALHGIYDSSCSLMMESDIDMNELMNRSS